MQNQESGCADCCLQAAQPLAESEKPEWKPVLLTIANLDFAKGTRLYGEGEAVVQLYSLRSGLVKLVHHLPNGKERIVRLLRKGDVAGFEVFRHPHYKHTAIALEPVNACCIHKASMAALDQHPILHKALLDRWERNLETADWWITQLSTGPLNARMARLIRYLKQMDGVCPAHLVKLPHREDMASMLGVATETLCRGMGEFQRQGLLKKVESGVFEFDKKAIDKLAEDWR